MELIFLDRFSKNTEISNFMKIRLVEAKLFHAGGPASVRTDGQTNMTKPIVAFRTFLNAPKINWLMLFMKLISLFLGIL